LCDMETQFYLLKVVNVEFHHFQNLCCSVFGRVYDVYLGDLRISRSFAEHRREVRNSG
jgi:hypothetical protein